MQVMIATGPHLKSFRENIQELLDYGYKPEGVVFMSKEGYYCLIMILGNKQNV